MYRILALACAAVVSVSGAWPVLAGGNPPVNTDQRVDESWSHFNLEDSDGGRKPAIAYFRSDEGGSLWLSCGRQSKGEPLIRVSAGGTRHLGKGVLPRRVTLVRFDETYPEQQPWHYGDNFGAPASFELNEQFIARLVQANRVQIYLADYRLETIVLNFRLAPLETKQLFDRMRSSCQNFARSNNF